MAKVVLVSAAALSSRFAGGGNDDEVSLTMTLQATEDDTPVWSGCFMLVLVEFSFCTSSMAKDERPATWPRSVSSQEGELKRWTIVKLQRSINFGEIVGSFEWR